MPKLRISLAADFGLKRGQVQTGIVVEATLDTLRRTAANKLKLSKKQVAQLRFFAATAKDRPKVELHSDAELSRVPNDTIITLSLTPASDAGSMSIAKPPGWPFPRGDVEDGEEDAQDDAVELPSTEETSVPVCPPSTVVPIDTPNLSEREMNGIFPNLSGCVLAHIREAVAGVQGIIERDQGAFIAFDYNSSDVRALFPDPFSSRKSVDCWKLAVRRECRGLIVCPSTGKVLARRFPKFFNVNELEETRAETLSFEEHSTFTEKIDGKLASPFHLSDRVCWATKNLLSPSIEAFVADRSGYAAAAMHWLSLGYTPLFEWCERAQKVGAISHAADALILLAIRHMETGEYVPYDQVLAVGQEYGIPVARQIPLSELIPAPPVPTPASVVVDAVLKLDGTEGIVVTTPSGQMYKVKTEWYTALVQAQAAGGANQLVDFLKRRPTLSNAPPDLVWDAALAENRDDVLPTCLALLRRGVESNVAAEQDCLRSVFEQVDSAVCQLDEQLLVWATGIRVSGGKATAQAVEIAVAVGWRGQLIRDYIAGKDARDSLRAQLRVLVQKRNWPAIEHLLRLRVNEGLRCRDEESSAPADSSECSITPCDIGDFQQASDDVVEHVLETYLPRKIANYLGVPVSSVLPDTVVHVDSNHAPDEGKIKGMWERFARDKIVDLRVDLQPPRAAGHDAHYGDKDWANWQVQYGPSAVCKRSSKFGSGLTAGAFAGVFMRCGVDFRFEQLQEAMAASFKCQTFVRLDGGKASGQGQSSIGDGKIEPKIPTPKSSQTVSQVWCDLDGVLVDFARGLVDLAGCPPEELDEISTADMWRKVQSVPAFYDKLEWTSGGRRLWEFLNQLPCTHNPAILTGLPSGKYGKSAKKHKRQWCNRELGIDVRVVTCMSATKHEYANEGDILVDDRIGLKPAWERAGGVFVHHTSVDATIRQLESLFFGSDARSEEEVAAVQRIRDTVDWSQEATTYSVPESLITYVSQEQGTEALVSALRKATVVGLDVEWRPDDYLTVGQTIGRKSTAALLQLATQDGRVFLVDLIHISSKAETSILQMLRSSSILKLGFGLEDDLARLRFSVTTEVVNTLDLQCVVAKLAFPKIDLGAKLSLGRAVRGLLGCDMLKSKALQASDWEARPLTREQILYAAADAAALVALFQRLEAEPVLKRSLESWTTSLLIRAKRKEKVKVRFQEVAELLDAPKPQGTGLGGSAVPTLSAVYLTPAARAALMEAVKPKHRVVYADHVTLAFQPTAKDLNGLAVGRNGRIQVLREIFDERIQALEVRFVDDSDDDELAAVLTARCRNAHPHITVSTAPGVSPGYSNELFAKLAADMSEPCEAVGMVFEGVVGVRVSSQGSDGAGLPQRVMERLASFLESAQVGEHLKFRPDELTSAERFLVHQWAEEHAVESVSVGKGEERRLELRMKKKRKGGEDSHAGGRVFESSDNLGNDDGAKKGKQKPGAKKKGGVVRLITDADVFNSMHLAFANVSLDEKPSAEVQNGATSEEQVAGRVTENGISWNEDREETESMRTLKRLLLARRPEGSATQPSFTGSVQLWSFGYRHGQPTETCHNFNLRSMANPSRQSRKGRTGLDARLRKEVLGAPGAAAFLGKICEDIVKLVREAAERGESTVVVGLGCEQGMHRSVAAVEHLKTRLTEAVGCDVSTHHRELVEQLESEDSGSGSEEGSVCDDTESGESAGEEEGTEEDNTETSSSGDDQSQDGTDQEDDGDAVPSCERVTLVVLRGEAPRVTFHHTCFAKAYDTKKVKQAHAHCRETFDEALVSHHIPDHGGAGLIVIDNTNIKCSEYQGYINAVRAAGGEVVVIELSTPTQESLETCYRRCTHGVPFKDLGRMFGRWEPDPRAIKLAIWNSPEKQQDVQPAVAEGALERFLTSNHLYHFNKKRPSTHCRCAVGRLPFSFVSVPPELEDEFLRLFVADSAPKYLCEICGPVFPFFLDIDHEGTQPLRDQRLVSFARLVQVSTLVMSNTIDPCTLQKVVGEFYSDASVDLQCICSGPPLEDVVEKPGVLKGGVHVKIPGVRLDTSTLLTVRGALVAALRREWGEHEAKPWDDIIDQHALAVNRSLRMQGSRKVRKDTDIGRVYERLVVLDGSGNVDPAAMSRYAADEVSFLRRVSLCFSQGPQTPLRPAEQ